MAVAGTRVNVSEQVRSKTPMHLTSWILDTWTLGSLIAYHSPAYLLRPRLQSYVAEDNVCYVARRRQRRRRTQKSLALGGYL